MKITPGMKFRDPVTLLPVFVDRRHVGDQVDEICKGDHGYDVFYEVIPKEYDLAINKLDNEWYRVSEATRECTCGLIELTQVERDELAAESVSNFNASQRQKREIRYANEADHLRYDLEELEKSGQTVNWSPWLAIKAQIRSDLQYSVVSQT